ncbi:MAG: hypothetical protein FD139_147 [Methylocystaceae bacterium]|nr:MAG: hypothetical protein FD148_94 [Methylocystaceae bacterium]KAF0212714.1 MAG: hypothetical protein FD172_1033 [Methylocystaceae bacterium]TXT48225.1 MAG: hypothetical protein FD139_147 [Methylocystaceae bacterium]
MQLQPSDPDIQTIVGRIRSNDLDLQPDFQRGEVWPLAKKKRLIDSILRGWHIPPIHVVVDKVGRQVVLDGQQRLVSIRDFVNGEFGIEGSIEPLEPAIQRLDGRRYETLPSEVRRAFDQFTIRVFRLTDYSPEEPGELFFRLNQMTYLTAAEQRNAFFGPVRQQVKDLVQQLQLQEDEDLIGFSNRRMAYDDVIAKVLCTFEAGTLAKKLTAGDISNRFRKADPFRADHFAIAGRAIALLNSLLRDADSKARFNKATLFTWLVFLSYFARQMPDVNLAPFMDYFNKQREGTTQGVLENAVLELPIPNTYELRLMMIYIDRSSSRVSDVSSVILRDFIVWVLFFIYSGDNFPRDLLSIQKYHILVNSRDTIFKQSQVFSEAGVERNIDFEVWGSLR